MWDFFIRKNKFAYLFLVALVAVGAYSIVSIPKESAPEVEIPVGIVTVVYPGAPATDVEALVTNEIERGLSGLDGVKQITSTSRESVSSVIVEFVAEADLEDSIRKLKDRVDVIERELPTEAEDASVSEIDFVDQPILTVALSADRTDFEFAAIARQVKKELELVSGVSRIETAGVRDREVAIIVNQTALIQYGLTLGEVTNAIRNANLTFPIGQIAHDGISYNIAFEGGIDSSEQIGAVPVAARGGQPVYIRDIAIIEDGLSPATSFSRLSVDGEPSRNSITLNIYKRTGGDITRIAAAANTAIADLQQPGMVLDGIDASVVLDSGDMIKQDLIKLSTSGLQTVVLVVLLLVLAIGWREGLLAGTAIPLSFLFGFIGLYFSGNTINFLSLFSLILGIGILVDSAIVMVEGINRKMKDHPTIDKRQAAVETIHEFAIPLITGTLTTVAMFSGLFIVSGVIGQFIASIPFTLIFLLFASLFVAIAILPLFAAAVLHRQVTSKFEAKQIVVAHKLETWYRGKLYPYLHDEHKQQQFLALLFAGLVLAISLTFNFIAGLLAAPLVYALSLWVRKLQLRYRLRNWLRAVIWFPAVALVIGMTFTVSGLLFPSFNLVKVAFFEQGDVDYVIVELEMKEGTVKEVTDIAVRRVEEILYNQPDIASFTVTVGSGSQFTGGGVGEKFANVFINLDTKRERTSTEIVETLRREFVTLPDLDITVNQPSEGPPTGAAIVVKFLGEDLTELTTLANQAAQIMREQPGIINVQPSTNTNNTEFVLTLDQARAAALGQNPFTISQIARNAVFGTKATSLSSLDEDIDVVVKLNLLNVDSVTSETANAVTIDAIEQIKIPSPSGTVPLGTLVNTSLRESSTAISHEDGRRVVSVNADVSADTNVREAQAAVIAKITEQLPIPDGIEISTGGGETDESNKAFLELFAALVAGVLMMLAILVLQFNSFLYTRYVLSILPYSLIGILTGLALTGNALSFPSIMGFIALSGIVVNNSILLIDMMNRMRVRDEQKAIADVVLDAAGNRIRPILLTMLTTVFGMLPLAFAGGIWAPFAYAVMFGLIFSVFITLILVPILYVRNPGKLS
jgi:multidrug efflux pump subunit AcrB